MVLLHKPRPTFREQLHVHAFDICAALGWQLGDMFRHVPQFASLRGMLQKPLQDRRPRFLGCLAVVFWFHGSSGSNAARRGCHCSHGSVMEALRISSAVVPADAVAQEVEAKDDAAAAVTHVEESEAGPLKVFVCSDEFEIACGCAICFSVFVICLQTDSVDLPFLIQFSESMVTAFFLLEWCLRDSEHLLDTFIVWCPGVIVVWIMQPLQIEAEASDLFKFFRIARMLRFVQLVKAFKHVGAFEDLWKLVRGLVSSGGTLASAMSLIVFNLYVFAIFCCELIGFQQFPVDASDGAKEAQERFKGISASMLTLTRFMHGDDSQGIMDALVEELPWIWIFLWLFTAMSSFVLLNLVTAVIVQQAMDMSKGDEKEMAILRKREQEREMKELEEMFREIDEDGSGIVSLAEFKEAFKDPAICDKFLMLGLKEEQAMELFSLLDTGGEGELDLSEFMQGMSQLKGVAKNKDEDVCTLSQALYTCRFFWSTWEDMVMLTKGIERLGKGIIRMGEGMGLHGLKDEHEERGEGKLKERVGKLRSKVRERLQKSEDEMLRLSSRMDRMLKQTEVAIRRIKTGQPAGSGQADSSKDDLAKSRSRRRDGDKKEKDSKEQKELKDRKEKDGRNVPSLRGPSWLGLAAFGSSSGEGRADVVMPRRSDSRSDSRPRRGSGRGRSRSAKRGRRDDSRDRGRRGGRSRSDGGRPGEALSEWGTSGVIVDLKGSGFGFIRPDTGKVNDKDLYFHCTAVNKSVPFDELRVNDEVNYEAVRDDRKGHPTAKNVTLKNGGSSSKRKDSRSTSRRR
eukprot:s4385_g4.t1